MKLLNAIKNNEFYPTPASLAQKMIEGIDWKMVKTILEPSAGKGDILKKVAWNTKDVYNKEFDVDCIESDADLRQLLKYNFSKEYRETLRREIEEILKVSGYEGADDRFGYGDWRYQDRETREYLTIPEDVAAKIRIVEEKEKSFFQDGIHIVADDFLSFEAFKQYDLILMNPPFSNGDRHLLKALDIQKVHGGSVVCILNAETLRNPYTETRKALVRLLEEYHADIEYIEDAYNGFKEAVSTQYPPICGMDENTVNYLLASLGIKCRDYDNAKRFAGAIVTSRTAPASIKEKARVLLEQIKKDGQNKVSD